MFITLLFVDPIDDVICYVKILMGIH